MKLLLSIEPRPVSTWGVTLSNLLPKKEWFELARQCKQEADYTCVVCGTESRKMHAHEVWSFDDKKKVQKLEDVICICVLCHDVKHFGRSTQVYGKRYQTELIKHWCKVNKLTKEDFQKHLNDIRTLNHKRVKVFYVVEVGGHILG